MNEHQIIAHAITDHLNKLWLLQEITVDYYSERRYALGSIPVVAIKKDYYWTTIYFHPDNIKIQKASHQRGSRRYCVLTLDYDDPNLIQQIEHYAKP